MRMRAPIPAIVGLALAIVAVLPGTAAAQETQPAGRSSNWSGYIATNAYYTGVTATIQVPTIADTNHQGMVSSWVGIGGTTSQDLIQGGVEAINFNGKQTYHAWLETLPQASRLIDVEVQPGDLVMVDIHETSPNVWQGTVVDGQQVYQNTTTYVSSHSSAEWIVEAPALMTGFIVPLASVSGANFTNMSAVANGISSTPNQLSPQQSVMVGPRGGVKATPSALGTDGASFSVTTSVVQ